MARRPSCHLISIFIDIAFIKFLASEEFKFTLSAQCLDTSCVSQDLGQFRSRSECASNCSASNSCVGFSYTADGACSSLQDGCTFDTACTSVQPRTSVYRKEPCLNSGRWNEQLHTCDCVDGWVGSNCARRPHNCSELMSFRYSLGIMHRVYIDVYRNLSRLVYTQCAINENYVQTYIFSNGGSQSFNKPWDEYLHGFELGPWHWWLGLENILAFNQMGHRNLVYCLVVQASNFAWEFGYSNFTMNDESEGFSFTSDFTYNTSYGQYFMTTQQSPQDIISRSQGVPFSAPNMDRDKDDNSCAALHKAGWWFNTCTTGEDLNPLGLVSRAGTPTTILSRLQLPGVNTEDQEFIDNFMSVLLAFID